MSISLTSLADQTIVITGASSGIGLATAQRAAKKGAPVVLSLRNEEALKEAVYVIGAKGCRATIRSRGFERQFPAVTEFDVYGGIQTYCHNRSGGSL